MKKKIGTFLDWGKKDTETMLTLAPLAVVLGMLIGAWLL